MVRSWLASPLGGLVPCAIAILLKLWLISDFQVMPIYAPYDDFRFVRQALSILEWKWLGPFDHLTLAKGPFFPMWLAAMHLLSLPYILALQISYLAACIVFLLALRPFRLVRWRQTLIFAILWFSPASFVATDFRVERSALYPSLVLLAVAFAIGLTVRCSQAVRPSIVWPVGLGLSFAAFWLTREEGVWLLPTLLCILIGGLLREVLMRSPRWPFLFSSWTLSAGLFFAGLALVAGANYFFYQRFILIEGRDPAFVDAYRAMTSVGDDSPRLLVPMSARAIEKAASVSPAFAEIRPFILAAYPGWRDSATTSWTQMYPGGLMKQTLSDDSEAIGGYFVWNVLAAVQQAGYYRNAATAHDYYVRLAGELHASCDASRIVCRSSGEDVVPGWKSVAREAFIDSFERSLRLSFIFPGVGFPGQCEHIDPVVLSDFRRLTRSAIDCRPSSQVSLKGWVVTKKGDISMVASDRSVTVWRLSGFLASPDVAAHFAGSEWQSTHPENARFEAELPCADCDFVLQINGLTVKSAPASQWRPDCKEGDGWQMCIDEVLQQTESQPRLTRLMVKVRRAVLTLLGNVYDYIMSIAGIALLVSLIRIRSNFGGEALSLLFASACLLAVFTRAFILAWVDVVSFPSIALQYTHASYVLLLAGTVFLALAATRNDSSRRNLEVSG